MFFSKVQKVKFFPHLLSNHRNFFSESSYGKYLSTFLGPVTSILTFLQFSQNAHDYIDPSGHFALMKFFVAQTSSTRFFLQLLKS